MKHSVLRNQHLNGWEYGIVRSFEEAICKHTRATLIEYPEIQLPRLLLEKFSQGYDRGKYRKFLPKTPFNPECDVLWVILMGPETYYLDLYKGWEKSASKKVLYLCDTLPAQMDTIRRLFANDHFDLCITAFHEAVPKLEEVTGRKWFGLVQAAPQELFYPCDINEKTIHFSAYGRRLPAFHDLLLDFCKSNNLYYDYTTHDGRHPTAVPEELYKQYAWHVRHSLFNVSWPVEITNPSRAGYLRPITARWFEAGLSGSIIIGQAPDNNMFYEDLCKDILVTFKNMDNTIENYNQLDNIWEKRLVLFNKAQEIAKYNRERWSWKSRVNTILEWLNE